MVRAGPARFRLWIFPMAPNLLVWPGASLTLCFRRPIWGQYPFAKLRLGAGVSPWLRAGVL